MNIYNVTVQNGQAIIANDNSTVTANAHIGASASESEKLIASVRAATNTLASAEEKEVVGAAEFGAAVAALIQFVGPML